MAKFWEVGLGATGEAVKNVQNALNNAGYKLDVDGIFGNKTLAAVKDYQQKNSLDVDGIVGNYTWGSLVNNLANKTASATSAISSNVAKATGTQTKAPEQAQAPAQTSNKTNLQGVVSGDTGGFSYKAYEESDAVKQAQALLQQQLANKPGEYQSQWQTQLNEAMDKILNREKFSYDLNGDALYQQYKDQYTLQGQQAMMDTMGQAQAMTGGYGNSYAQTVGQQTYQGYLQQLNDKVPELYQLALNQYNQEGQDLYNQYGLYADRENQDYGRYRDTVSDYYTELDRLTSDARYQSETDYNRYMDAYNQAYGQHRDSVADSQWQKQFDEAQRQYEQNFQYQQGRDQVADDQWNQSFQYQQNRDQVADNQWQQNFDYQKDRDAVADSQWNQSFEYQQGRDQVADSQWQQQFDEAQRQYEQNFQYQQDRDKVSDSQWDQSFQYQQDRDKVSDSQWNQSFQYQQAQDKIAQDQWNQSFQYQQSQDKIAQDQWNQSMEYQQDRDKVSDSQWQKEFDEAIRQYNHKNGISTSSSSTGSTGSTGSAGNTGNTGNTGGKGYDNGTVIDENIKKIQKALGVTADGKWGPASQAAAQKKWGVTSANDAWKRYTGAVSTPTQPQTQNTGFTGTTYESAVAYMKENGVSSASAAGVMTKSEWNRRKSSLQTTGTGGVEVKNYSSYQEYLKDYVQYQIEKK